MTTKAKVAPGRYASGTSVGPSATAQQIQDYLRSRGAQNVVVTQDDDHHFIVCAFRLFARQIVMRGQLPTADTPRMQRKSGFRPPSAEDINKRVDTEVARKWRVMLTRIKMRLDLIFDEADEAGREEAFRAEFLGDTALPGGGTVAEFMVPQVEQAYATGQPPRLLPEAHHFARLEGSDA